MCKVNKIYDFPFEKHMDKTVNQIRELLQLDMGQLAACYRKEISMIADSKESMRLQNILEGGNL